MMTRSRFAPAVFWLALAAPALAGPVVASEPAKTTFSRWYQVFLDQEQIGYMNTTTRESSTVIESTTLMKLSMRRGEVEIAISIATAFAETPDGKPIRATSEQMLGGLVMRQKVTFGPESMDVVTTQGDRQRHSTVTTTEADRNFLTPAAAERYVHDRIAAGDKEIKWWAFDPATSLKRFESKLTIKGKEDIEIAGRHVTAFSAAQVGSNMPGITLLAHVDEFGRPLKSTMPVIGGLSITVVQATEEDARKPGKAGEVMVASFVKPDHPIQKPRTLRSAVYQITLQPDQSAGDGATTRPASGLVDFPRGGYQRVVWTDESTATVVVDLSSPVNPLDDVPRKEHRKASDYLDFEDEKIKALLKKALSGQPDDLSASRKAEILRKFVHDYVETKDLTVGFATATEVARTGRGDCTEHAVLLAALLRAAGIPSRVVSGLLYVEEFAGQKDVFGYHMWTQAWLPAERRIADTSNKTGSAAKAHSTGAFTSGAGWVDLDAVLEDVPFDAAHIALSRSSLSDQDGVLDMGQLLRMTGRLKISVLDAEQEK